MQGWGRPEQDALHRRVVQEPGPGLLHDSGDRLPFLGRVDDAARHGGAHGEHGLRLLAHGLGQRLQVEPPSAVDHPERHQAGHAAGKADTVDEAGVGRVADDDLVAGLQHGKQRVEDARKAARRDHALRAPVVGDAGVGLEPRDHRLPERVNAEEGQVAVRVVARHSRVGGVDGGLGRRNVGIQVLQPEHLGIERGIRRIAHAVDADAGDVAQSRDRHRPVAAALDARSGPVQSSCRGMKFDQAMT